MQNSLRFIVCSFFALFSLSLFAQQPGKVDVTITNGALIDFIRLIEKQSDYTFIFNNSINLDQKINVNAHQEDIQAVLDKVFNSKEISYEIIGKQIILKSLTAGLQVENGQSDEKLVISGRVFDTNGVPIPGVTILIIGTKNSTTSNTNGEYTIREVARDASIEYSFVGFKTQLINVLGKTKIDVTLSEDITVLEEMVVIGYGTQRKGDVTSSIASVKAEDFTTGNIADAGELIKGKVAGLSVTKGNGDPNNQSTIRLRGVISLMGSSTPLVLIDGIEGDLNSVAPENIASIDILKDASAAAIYGTRGANGVIIITTKIGQRNESVTVNYSGYASVSNFTKTDIGFMTAEDIRNGLTDFTDLGYETDWVKEISRTAFTNNHNISVTGGTKSTAYSASFTYRNAEGVIRNTYNDEMRMKVNVSHWMLKDMLKLSFELQKTIHKNSATEASADGYSNIFHQAITYNPTAPVRNADGSWYENLGASYYYNPVAIVEELVGDTKSENTRMTGTVTFEPVKGWQTNLVLGTTRSNVHNTAFYTSDYYSSKMNSYTGQASQSYAYYESNILEITSNYKHQWGQHRFEALAGYSYQYNMNENFNAYNRNFPTDFFQAYNLGVGTALKTGEATMESSKNDSKLVGFFGRISYGYADRYNVLLSMRREGSSKFGANNKWGTFPSASFRWNIINEDFMKGIKWLNNLDIRAGFGITGVIPNTSYISLTKYDYGSSYYFQNGQWLPGLEIASNPNPDLKWEKSREINIVLDWSVLDNRFGGSIDFYNKKTTDLLWEYAVPTPPNLYETTIANVGVIRNTGVEVSINVVPVRTKNFEWKMNVTGSHNRNILLSLSNDLYETENFIDIGYTSGISIASHRLEVGQSLDNYFGLKSVGVSENGVFLIENPQTGEIEEFEAGMNTNADYKQYLGHGLPDLYLGMNNTFFYKNFDLSIQLTSQLGFQILNENRWLYENNTYAFNRMKSVTVPPYGGQYTLTANQQKTYVSYFLEDGDFVKVTNMTLGYNVPLKGTGLVKGLRAYVSGDNLLTITKYTGIDPELSNETIGSFGNDYHDTYPQIRSFIIGVHLTF